jgi:Tfp pilus assembly protein PilF
MDSAAEREWRRIEATLRDTKAVLVLGIEIARRRSRWVTMLQRSRRFRRLHPEGVDGWLMLSFAVRRADSIQAAYDVLDVARREHPDHPLVRFNLGCYACLLGRHDEAVKLVLEAVVLDDTLAAAALRDPDLVSIRDRLAAVTKTGSEPPQVPPGAPRLSAAS